MTSPFKQGEVQGFTSGVHSRSLVRQRTRKNKVLSKVKPERDIVWQEYPARILKYRGSNLHYYGWIPFFIFRNIKATVFSEIYIHIQTIVLLIWVALLHLNGLGIDKNDFISFTKMFGTPYMGSVFNFGMVVVFILGLFITLVINRWWAIRMSYTKLIGTTTDLCMIVATVVKDKDEFNDKRILRARTEITRLLNLGHLLVITRADSQNNDFKKSYGLRTGAKKFFECISGISKSDDIENDEKSDILKESKYSKPRRIDYEDLINEGLLNEDEWGLLKNAEEEGMPAYQTVYYWTQSLIQKCKNTGWIMSAPQMLPLMLNKVNAIVESSSQIFTTINSQMPYPYVHLVSFVVHIYLFILSTWFGCFLNSGYQGETFVMTDENKINIGSLTKDPGDISDKTWTVVWSYLFVAVANIMYQGLLDMHSLLDNPFGGHCAKFALRAHTSDVMNASRTMLINAHKLPDAFNDVFNLGDESEEVSIKSPQIHTKQSAVSDFVDFLHPPSFYGEDSVPETGSLQYGEDEVLMHKKNHESNNLKTKKSSLIEQSIIEEKNDKTPFNHNQDIEKNVESMYPVLKDEHISKSVRSSQETGDSLLKEEYFRDAIRISFSKTNKDEIEVGDKDEHEIV